MEFFVYGRDRAGALELKQGLTEEHWGFMDRYTKEMVARGPTMSGAGEYDGSLHIVDLPDLDAARSFAYDEPYYRAGAFQDVDIYRFNNILGRTMWDFTDATDGYGRFLLIAFDAPTPDRSKHLIVYGDLLDPGHESRLGWAALLEAPDLEAATTLLPAGRGEIHRWRFGGRPVQD
ncbi:hypothetical protein EV646_105398 [Kribbella antiqua]|uniref:YCII-related domain-containing protein n=1 Tax=Kribbella antiqua TaxID=2512217 RepID=A0A4R2IR47_9ACTN|nr:YciI family protein [Kribbella antiqua]TCO47841.1 hypothetical protein EV646_105398 [Kribbella antiqua]